MTKQELIDAINRGSILAGRDVSGTAVGYQVIFDRHGEKIQSAGLRDERGILYWIRLKELEVKI